MKKICLIILIGLFVITYVSGQTKEFTNHMTKAKEYENKRKWCFALAEYYEALGTDDTIEIKTDAYEKYISLASTIENGKPGYGNFDDFSLIDNWILLMQDYEEYWTKNCPMIFLLSNPKRIELNREKKTAIYEVHVKYEKSIKYDEITKTITCGFKKAYNEDWNMDYLKTWPDISVYNSKNDKNKFIQNGAVLTQNLLQSQDAWGKSYAYSEYKMLASTALFGCIEKGLDGVYRVYNNETTLYDLKILLNDTENNTIFESGRLLVGPESKYEFEVTQNNMNRIEEGKYTFLPKALYLKYGNIPTEPWITKNSREWIKTLSEIEIPVETVSLVSENKSAKIYESNISRVEREIDKIREEDNKKKQAYKEQIRKEKEKEEKKRRSLVEINSNISIFYKMVASWEAGNVKNKYYVKFLYDNDIEFERFYYDKANNEAKKQYSSEIYYTAMKYVLCNAVSLYENLTPVYFIAEHEMYESFLDEFSFYLENFDKIESNSNATGYRIPTSEECKFMKNKDIKMKRDGYDHSIIIEKDRLIIRNIK